MKHLSKPPKPSSFQKHQFQITLLLMLIYQTSNSTIIISLWKPFHTLPSLSLCHFYSLLTFIFICVYFKLSHRQPKTIQTTITYCYKPWYVCLWARFKNIDKNDNRKIWIWGHGLGNISHGSLPSLCALFLFVLFCFRMIILLCTAAFRNSKWTWKKKKHFG